MIDLNEINENDIIQLTPEWMSSEYNRLNTLLFDGKLGACLFRIFTTGKGSEGGVLGWFKITGTGIYVSKRYRKMYVVKGGEKVWVDENNFADICKPAIELNGNYRWTKKAAMSTLVHEMCHYYCNMRGWRPTQHHGPEFRSIAVRVSQKSKEFFTVERIAKAEQMSEMELNSVFAEKKKRRIEAKKSRVTAMFLFMSNGTVRLVNAVNAELIDDIAKMETRKGNCRKILLSQDPELLAAIFESGRRATMRTYRYWNVENADFVKNIDKYNTEIKYDKGRTLEENMKITIDEDFIRETVRESLTLFLNERRDIIRRMGDYEDYDGYEDDYGDHEGTAYITLDEDSLREAVIKVFGKDVFDELDLPEEVEISYYIREDGDRGDYWTPPSSECELVDWDLTDSEKKIAGDERIVEVLKLAASDYLDGIDPSELL